MASSSASPGEEWTELDFFRYLLARLDTLHDFNDPYTSKEVYEGLESCPNLQIDTLLKKYEEVTNKKPNNELMNLIHKNFSKFNIDNNVENIIQLLQSKSRNEIFHSIEIIVSLNNKKQHIQKIVFPTPDESCIDQILIQTKDGITLLSYNEEKYNLDQLLFKVNTFFGWRVVYRDEERNFENDFTFSSQYKKLISLNNGDTINIGPTLDIDGESIDGIKFTKCTIENLSDIKYSNDAIYREFEYTKILESPQQNKEAPKSERLKRSASAKSSLIEIKKTIQLKEFEYNTQWKCEIDNWDLDLKALPVPSKFDLKPSSKKIDDHSDVLNKLQIGDYILIWWEDVEKNKPITKLSLNSGKIIYVGEIEIDTYDNTHFRKATIIYKNKEVDQTRLYIDLYGKYKSTGWSFFEETTDLADTGDLYTDECSNIWTFAIFHDRSEISMCSQISSKNIKINWKITDNEMLKIESTNDLSICFTSSTNIENITLELSQAKVNRDTKKIKQLTNDLKDLKSKNFITCKVIGSPKLEFGIENRKVKGASYILLTVYMNITFITSDNIEPNQLTNSNIIKNSSSYTFKCIELLHNNNNWDGNVENAFQDGGWVNISNGDEFNMRKKSKPDFLQCAIGFESDCIRFFEKEYSGHDIGIQCSNTRASNSYIFIKDVKSNLTPFDIETFKQYSMVSIHFLHEESDRNIVQMYINSFFQDNDLNCQQLMYLNDAVDPRYSNRLSNVCSIVNEWDSSNDTYVQYMCSTPKCFNFDEFPVTNADVDKDEKKEMKYILNKFDPEKTKIIRDSSDKKLRFITSNNISCKHFKLYKNGTQYKDQIPVSKNPISYTFKKFIPKRQIDEDLPLDASAISHAFTSPSTSPSTSSPINTIPRLETILDKFYTIENEMVSKGDAAYGLDIKRSGDAFQVIRVKTLNNLCKSEKKVIFITNDKLAFLHARLLKVPCILVTNIPTPIVTLYNPDHINPSPNPTSNPTSNPTPNPSTTPKRTLQSTSELRTSKRTRSDILFSNLWVKTNVPLNSNVLMTGGKPEEGNDEVSLNVQGVIFKLFCAFMISLEQLNSEILIHDFLNSKNIYDYLCNEIDEDRLMLKCFTVLNSLYDIDFSTFYNNKHSESEQYESGHHNLIAELQSMYPNLHDAYLYLKAPFTMKFEFQQNQDFHYTPLDFFQYSFYKCLYSDLKRRKYEKLMKLAQTLLELNGLEQEAHPENNSPLDNNNQANASRKPPKIRISDVASRPLSTRMVVKPPSTFSMGGNQPNFNLQEYHNQYYPSYSAFYKK